jgi:hypothetical protein
MDPITLTTVATQVVAILASLFSKVGESIATKFGEDAYEGSKHLYEVVRDRFAKKDDDGGRANKALQNFADDPQLYGNIFKEMLLPLLHDDPNFADTLNVILHSGPIQRITVGADAKVEDTQMSNESGQGTQTIEGGDRATFSGISMNIGPKREQGK